MLAVTSAGLTLTVPGSEVRADANWWQYFLALALGGSTTLLLRMLCVGIMPTAAVVCAAASNFVGTLAGRLVIQAFDGTLWDGQAWAITMLSVLFAAAGPALWEAGVNAFSKKSCPASWHPSAPR